MACSQSLGNLTALRWVSVQDLKMREKTIQLLEENWPYERTDFGGGVRIISLDDLETKSLEDFQKIKGIGPARAEEIHKAVRQALSERPFGF